MHHQTCECQHFRGKEHNADGGQCHWFNLFQRHQPLQSLPAPCLSRISYARGAPAPLISANNYGDTCLSPASPGDKCIHSSLLVTCRSSQEFCKLWDLTGSFRAVFGCWSHSPLQGQLSPAWGWPLQLLQPKLHGKGPNSPSN